MTTPLPPVISAYFAAAEHDNVDALVDCFTADAVVIDEDAEWRGQAEIRRWRETVATKFEYTLEVRNARPRPEIDGDERINVQTHLEGNFPGGAVDLDYGFALRGELISALEIVPTSSEQP